MYIKQLFRTGKTDRNMEKMMEPYHQADYHRIQHFISESPWDHRTAFDDAAKDCSQFLTGLGKVGLLIDESGIEKKGDSSVGVARQYCGRVGKVTNCQIGVFACLAAGENSALIDARLYLPKAWIEDSARCKKAGIPIKEQEFKTKGELALEIVKTQKEKGIKFDFVGGDGFYGHDTKLQEGLDELGLCFMLDIHSRDKIFLEPFEMELPQKKGTRGRKVKNMQANKKSISASKYYKTLSNKDFTKVSLRKTAKGELVSYLHVAKVYIQITDTNQCRERLLLIRKTRNQTGSYEIKFALSNAKEGQCTLKELGQMQAQRFWIEHAIKQTKEELGMADYQFRGWLAWHHHMALIVMANAFVLSEKIYQKETMPLLSTLDVRELLVHQLAETSFSKLPIEEQIRIRHKKRQSDIDRYAYKSDD